MKILSMTATFGKLEHETINFREDIQVIEAPNEWGKSTWCAFITAMLYGIDSRQRTTDAVLADKERFKPWSGAPMGGRMEIEYQGKRITLERQSKSRLQMNQFRAFDTATGANIPELTADNCGLILLGVEKDVFLRSAFIRESDFPVSDNQALRARLNALVTTGDDSGAAQALAQKLKELKNKCRHNKTGLLPEAEQQYTVISQKLKELQNLQDQSKRLKTRLESLEQHEQGLKNHQAALEYQANLTYAQKLASAQNAKAVAQERLESLEASCAQLPQESALEAQLSSLRQLRAEREDIQMLSQMLPAAPVAPADMTGSDIAVAQAKTDFDTYTALSGKVCPIPVILSAVCFAAALALLFLPLPWVLTALLPAAIGAALLIRFFAGKRKKAKQIQQLLQKYPGVTPEKWEAATQNKLSARQNYEQALAAHTAQTESLQQRIKLLKEKAQTLTDGTSLAEYEQYLLDARQKRNALGDARRELVRAQDLLTALESSHRIVPPPQHPDELTYTAQETARLLSDSAISRNQLQRSLGQCQGQMAALGTEAHLQKQLDEIQNRITRLEQTYSALQLALDFLEKATQELQQRFAPRISRRAQQIMAQLTDGRYDRLYLSSDFSLNAGASQEDTLHTAQWRSDGTVDQLYFALRLAVAEELSGDAPLILDDAFVRFDDTRLQKALNLLREESKNKQVLIFTCQSRENRLLEQ